MRNAQTSVAPRYHLYGHAASGHSYKVALALAFGDIPYAFTPVDPFSERSSRAPDFMRKSRWNEIPLLTCDGDVLVQSNAILMRLAAVEQGTFGGEPHRIAEWLFWEANRIGFSLPNWRLQYLRGSTATPLAGWLFDRLTDDLATLNASLGDTAFLLGDDWSIADLSCAAYLLLDDVPDLVNDHPAVDAWLARLRAHPRWASARSLMPSSLETHGPESPGG